MEYPVIVEGQQQGTLRVEQEGLFTVFEARCAKREGLLRLSVYGGGREGYLGIMQPRGSGLYLKKKLSRAQLQGFPANVEYAGEAGCPGGRGGAQQSNAAASRKEPERKEPAPVPTAEKMAAPQGKKQSGAQWQRQSDGSLIRREGGGYILALPVQLRRSAPGAVIAEIDGQAYMLFRY